MCSITVWGYRVFRLKRLFCVTEIRFTTSSKDILCEPKIHFRLRNGLAQNQPESFRAIISLLTLSFPFSQFHSIEENEWNNMAHTGESVKITWPTLNLIGMATDCCIHQLKCANLSAENHFDIVVQWNRNYFRSVQYCVGIIMFV